MIDLQKVKELAMDIDGSLRMTDVDTGAYIEAAKEKTALLIAELGKPGNEIMRCPSCGCVVDKMGIGHHSASDCVFMHFADLHYAELYHAQHCASCNKLKSALNAHTRDRNDEIDGIAERE